jgi:predicted kinase
LVIIVFGLPGSGKSYFASKLAFALQAVYVNTDETRFRLIPHRTYSDTEKMQVYEVLLTRMSEALAQKQSIVLDGTFYKEAIRTRFEQIAASFREKIIFIEVRTSEDIIEDRLSKPRKYSEADFAVYLKLKAAFEPLLQDHLVLVSSNQNIDAMLEHALRYIQEQE